MSALDRIGRFFQFRGSSSRVLEITPGNLLATTAFTVSTMPICTAGERGVIMIRVAPPGQADLIAMCSKDASENYAWNVIPFA